jgi:hypothetical protein
MAGKLPVLATPAEAYALDQLSKNALIDILIDRVLLEVGDKLPREDQVAAALQDWIRPVLRARDDKPVDLTAALTRFRKLNQQYLDRKGN